jgi:Tfp pilus assembly protein PilN
VSVQTATRLANLPRVNLLPPEIGERKRLQAVQAGVVAAVVVSLVGVGYLYTDSKHKVTTAKQQLATVTATNTALTAKLATFAPVKQLATQLAASEAMLTQAMSTEVLWSQFLADLSTTAPASTWLTQLTLSESVRPGSLANPAQAPDVIGNLAAQGFAAPQGTASPWPSLADWLDSLDPTQKNGLATVQGATFATAVLADLAKHPVVQFQGSAVITSKALSDRCATAGSC